MFDSDACLAPHVVVFISPSPRCRDCWLHGLCRIVLPLVTLEAVPVSEFDDGWHASRKGSNKQRQLKERCALVLTWSLLSCFPEAAAASIGDVSVVVSRRAAAWAAAASVLVILLLP